MGANAKMHSDEFRVHSCILANSYEFTRIQIKFVEFLFHFRIKFRQDFMHSANSNAFHAFQRIPFSLHSCVHKIQEWLPPRLSAD